MLDPIRNIMRRRPLGAAAALLVIAVVGAGAAALLASAGPSNRVDELQARNAELSKRLRDAHHARNEALSRADKAEWQVARLRFRLTLTDYKTRRNELAAQLSDLGNQVAAQEAKLNAVKQEVAKSSFGDGTWQANVDFIPGTYEAPGGDRCYWAKLSSPSGEGIDNVIDNGGFNNRPIVNVDSPYFETSNCGTWHRMS